MGVKGDRDLGFFLRSMDGERDIEREGGEWEREERERERGGGE